MRFTLSVTVAGVLSAALGLFATGPVSAAPTPADAEAFVEAPAAFSGERDIDASAINDYFAPLSAWLDKQNKGNACRR